VTAEDRTPVDTGEVGELRVRAPFGMARYHGAPDITAETISADGWIRTRYLARMDDRGDLTLVDRASDMTLATTGAAPSAERPIRVVLTERYAAMRGILRMVVERVHGMEVVAVAGSLASAVRHVRQYRPHVLLIDPHRPGGHA
jgi:non-ribosomal peptide synthetase component E (peptide arylation enzyme)